jgi:hypothetical protein
VQYRAIRVTSAGYHWDLKAGPGLYTELLRLNPFPEGDPMREHFVRFASEKAEQQARLSSALAEKLAKAVTNADYIDFRVESACAFFDFNAEIIAAATTTANVEENIGHLDGLSDYFREIATANCGGLDRRTLWREVTARLTKHKFDWIAKFHQLARSRGDAQAGPPTGLTAHAQGAAEPAVAPAGEAARRRAAVDTYLEHASRIEGKRVTRTDFWKRAGYKSRTEFERWQRDDPKATKSAARNFERQLREKTGKP